MTINAASVSANAQAILDGAKSLLATGITEGRQALTFCAGKVSAIAHWAFAELSQVYASSSTFVTTHWPAVKVAVAPYSWHIAGGVAALVVLKVAYNLWQPTKPVAPQGE